MSRSINLFAALATLIMIVTACGVSQEAVQTAAAETVSAWTPVPTQTPLPTFTAVPTQTPLPTHTPQPTYTPYPTHTPFPSPTAPPEPTETPMKEVLYEQDFSDDSSCLNSNAAQESGMILNQDGVLRLDANGTDGETQFLWTFCDEEQFSDFSLEVEATQQSGTNNNGFGVLFRGNNDVAYTFLISGDGYYCLTLLDYINPENEFPILSCWAPLLAIKRGAQTNLLGVVADETRIELFVNGELVGHVRDANLFSGSIGFVALSYEEEGTVIEFDNLRVTAP